MISRRSSNIKHSVNQRGFSIVAAIFLVVVLGALGVFIVTIGSVQRTTTITALQAARAYEAARSGIEWGLLNATFAAGCFASPTAVDVTGAPGLAGMTVSVICTVSDHSEGLAGGTNRRIFTLTSTASSGTFGEPYYVSRQIRVSSVDAP